MPTPTNQQTRVMFLEALMRTSPHRGNSMGVRVEDASNAAGPGLNGESPSHNGLLEQTHSSPTHGLRYAESASEASASTHDTSKVAEMEDPVEFFTRIVENPDVLSPNSSSSPIDNYNKLFGKLKSKLFGIDFLLIVRDNPLILFETQGLLLKLRKPDVPGLISDILLNLEPLLEHDV